MRIVISGASGLLGTALTRDLEAAGNDVTRLVRGTRPAGPKEKPWVPASGRQFWPWIAMEDVLGAARLVLDRPDLSGPLNLVSPETARCTDFARTLGRVLHRPAYPTDAGLRRQTRSRGDGRCAAPRLRAGPPEGARKRRLRVSKPVP